jgi:hypothetical protein
MRCRGEQGDGQEPDAAPLPARSFQTTVWVVRGFRRVEGAIDLRDLLEHDGSPGLNDEQAPTRSAVS